jgi:serine/threonine protein kinase
MTPNRYVGIIMLPVADCDLGTFLESTTMDTKERSLLRTFFGCLTNATEYLQTHKIRHRDIKPQVRLLRRFTLLEANIGSKNVLVKAHQIFVTDFGASYDWSGRNDSITIGPTSKTPRYCAPEVAESGAKGSAAEIFSLGCVFLEMWTILCDRKLSELAAYMATNGTCMSAYHANITAVFMWCDMLASGHGFDALKPATWIKSMLQIAPQQRWTVHMLSECIGEVDLDPEVSVSFIGSCCREDHEIAESVHASTFHPSELLYQSRPLGGSRKEFAPPMHPVETILEVPNPQTPSYRDTLPDKVINWSRTARQPPPLPPRAQPIMIDRDRETTSHNVRAEIVKPSQGSIHDTEEPMSSESNESICMRHHDHRAPESSGTRDTGPRLNDTHVERRVHDGAEIKAEQNFCFGHGDNRRRNTSVHGDNLVNRSGTPSIRQSSMESVKRSHRSSASNSVHPKQGYPPRDRRSMRERLHRMVLPLDVPRSNKALVGLKETHTQFIDRLSKIEPLHGTSWATTTFMNTRAFKVKGELRSLLCDLVDALDNLGVAYIATGAGLECSYPTDGLWEIFNYTSMHHQRARVLKRWRSAFSGHRSSSKIRNAWYEHKLVFDITLAKRTEKMDNKFVLLFKTVSGGPSGNHLLHLLPSIFNRHGVGEDFLPSFVKTIKLELERQIC